MKFINPKVHGYLDYLYVIVFAMAPSMLALVGPESALCYLAAGAVLCLSLLTRYPLGILRKIPFMVHGYIELGAAIFLIVSPFLLGFFEIDAPRNFHMTAGALLLGLWLCTDYLATEKAEDRVAAERRERAAAR
jgi:hypothetical protein